MHVHPLTRDLVLIGGGHAHALVLRRWGMDPLPGARVTVINPGATAPYTGMLPGHVAGHYGRDDLDIDLLRLCRFAGAGFIDGAVEAIDPEHRVLSVGGREIAFDVASLDIGIHAEMPDLPGFAEHGVGAKPLGRFAEAWRAHRARGGDCAVIGGGVAGAELAMAMAHALPDATVTVIEAEDGLTGMAEGARRRVAAAMDRLGIRLRTGAAVARVSDEGVHLADGDLVRAAFVTGAAGARPHAWLRDTGLPLEDGFVRVGPTLQVEGRPDLFAVGDCAHMVHAPRPKAGVFAVRQAPVLHRNLRAALSGGAMRRFDPQKRYLKLISLGDRSAVADRGIALAGPWLWRWKDRIDRAFMDRLTDLPAMAPPAPPTVAAAGAEDLAKPLCAGCGAKVGPGALGAALAGLSHGRADVLSRPGDDAAVLRVGGATQVITTDHLRGFCENGLMARIAAVHALGDVWAMGAAPQAALVSLVLPRMSERMAARTARTILDAMEDVLAGAGAEIVGGHTTMGAEATFGLTLTGLAERPIGLDGARLGDALVLTRPLGTGALLAAAMAGAARGADVLAMLHAMARPQGDAAAILAGAHAMTDVTGFGLAGHLLNICRASGVAAELGEVPAYGGARAALAGGHASSLAPANAAHAPAGDPLLHDPQTAGGLLASVAAEVADDLVARLRAAGHPAARIGRIVEGPPALRG